METENFGTARSVIAAMQIIGWVVVGIAFVVAVFAFNERGFDQFVRLMAAGGTALSGLLIVAASQMSKATVATAMNTGKIVQLLAAQGAGAALQPGGQMSLTAPAPRMSSPPLEAGVIKRYKGRAIVRGASGEIQVGDRVFPSVLEAERHIREMG